MIHKKWCARRARVVFCAQRLSHMLFKKSMLSCVCVVFSCAGMEQAPQASMQARPTFKDAGSQAFNQSVITHELAQKVAQLSIATSTLSTKYARAEDFDLAQEHIKALRRGFYPHENNTLTQGLSPRVVAAVDCVLSQASITLLDGKDQFSKLSQPSSLPLADKKTLFTAQILSFKQLMNSLFASVDRDGKYYGDEPRVATKHVVTCYANGALLASVEALECFSQATDDTVSLCQSCKNCPPELWCSYCKDTERAHSRITPFVRNVARETEQRVGVDDALGYLESRIGATSSAIDAYASDAKVQSWQGSAHVGTLADTRKTILHIAAAHKDIVEGVAPMSEDQLQVEAVLGLLENSSKAIRMGEGIGNFMKFFAINPGWISTDLQKLCEATKDLPAGTTISGLAKMVQEKTKSTLGIADKELLLLCQLARIGSVPLNWSIKEVIAALHESSADVERFATVYKKPLREQLLTPACSKQFEQWAHAWKTGGIVAPQVILKVGAPDPITDNQYSVMLRGVKLREKQKQLDEESAGQRKVY